MFGREMLNIMLGFVGFCIFIFAVLMFGIAVTKPHTYIDPYTGCFYFVTGKFFVAPMTPRMKKDGTQICNDKHITKYIPPGAEGEALKILSPE